MQRSKTQLGMGNQQYEPLPFEEQVPGTGQGYEQNQFDMSRNNQQRMMMQGLAPSEWDDKQGADGKLQMSDQQNIKCSIEIKNGIPQRSLNNFHKN